MRPFGVWPASEAVGATTPRTAGSVLTAVAIGDTLEADAATLLYESAEINGCCVYWHDIYLPY